MKAKFFKFFFPLPNQQDQNGDIKYIKDKLDNAQILLKANDTPTVDVVSNYLGEIYKTYDQALSNGNPDTDDILKTLNKYTNFQNISFENIVHFEKIFEKTLAILPHGSNLFNNPKYKRLNIKFTKCVFSDLSLSTHLSADLLNSFIFENCNIKTVRINGHSANHHIYNLLFKKSVINNLLFCGKNSIQSSIVFLKCHFLENILSLRLPIFNNTLRFYKCIFENSPHFHASTFHVDTSFDKSRFKDTKSIGAVGNYRVLKNLTHEITAEHDSMMFHALELESRRKTVLPYWFNILDGRFLETWSSWFLKLLNNYGRNFWLPAFWLIMIWVAFSFLYLHYDVVNCNEFYIERSNDWLKGLCEGDKISKIHQTMAFSLNQSWGALGLLFNDGILGTQNFTGFILSKLQILLTTIIWFIWILQIRRQFKL